MRLGWTRSRSLTSDSLQWAGLQKRGSIPEAPPLASSALMNAEFQVIDLEIPAELAGQRLDSALARLLPEHSRTRIKGWIEAGQVQVGRLPANPGTSWSAGSRIHVRMQIDARRRARSAGGDCAHAWCTRIATCWWSTSRRDWWCIRAPAIRDHTLQNALLGLRPDARGTAARRHHPSTRQGHERSAGGCAHARGADLPDRGSSWRGPCRASISPCAWAS